MYMIIEPERRTELIKRKLHYQEVLGKEPDSPIFLRLAAVLMQLGDDKEALQVLEKGLARNPRYADPHILYARICISKGDFQVAESHLQIALEIDPYNTEARLEMATLLEESGKPKEATGLYQQILDEDPGDNTARKALARIRSQTLEKEYEELSSKKVSELEGKSSDQELEVSDWRAFISEAPEKEPVEPVFPKEEKEEFATLPLAEIYLSQGHLEKARDTVRKILSDSPGNSRARELLDKVEAQIAEQELPEGSLTLELIRDYSDSAAPDMVFEEMDLPRHESRRIPETRSFGTQLHPASAVAEGELPDVEEIKQRLEVDFSSPARPFTGFEEVVEMDVTGLLLDSKIPEPGKSADERARLREGTEILQIDGFIIDRSPDEGPTEKSGSFARSAYPESSAPAKRSEEVKLPETGRMLELPQEDNEDIETFQQWLNRLTRE
jgi:tetratricopeptide (TPR) repeat protein